MRRPQYFMLRIQRHGPLVPARIQWLDHEPGEPGNPRDSWPAVIPQVDIAGEVVPPEDLTDRFHWPAGHWKYAQPVTAAQYRHAFDRLRWAERNRPEDPTLRPRRRVSADQILLPSFDRENAI